MRNLEQFGKYVTTKYGVTLEEFHKKTPEERMSIMNNFSSFHSGDYYIIINNQNSTCDLHISDDYDGFWFHETYKSYEEAVSEAYNLMMFDKTILILV